MVLLFVLPALIFTYFWMSFSFFGRYCFVRMPCRTGSSFFFFQEPNNLLSQRSRRKKKKRKIIGNTKGRYLRIELFFADDMLRLILNLHLRSKCPWALWELCKLLAYQIMCLWVIYLNSRCIYSWHFKCKGASMKTLVRTKLYFPLKPQRVSRASQWTLQC